MSTGMTMRKTIFFLAAMAPIMATGPAYAHHSLAMYDTHKVYAFTGVVTGVIQSPAHLKIKFVPLNEARDKVIRDDNGEPIEWIVEMDGAAKAARDGITANNFPAGTIISVALFPLRTGGHGGARNKFGLFKCPPETPPAPGKFCDSVAGSTSHGKGVIPEGTDPVP